MGGTCSIHTLLGGRPSSPTMPNVILFSRSECGELLCRSGVDDVQDLNMYILLMNLQTKQALFQNVHIRTSYKKKPFCMLGLHISRYFGLNEDLVCVIYLRNTIESKSKCILHSCVDLKCKVTLLTVNTWSTPPMRVVIMAPALKHPLAVTITQYSLSTRHLGETSARLAFFHILCSLSRVENFLKKLSSLLPGLYCFGRSERHWPEAKLRISNHMTEGQSNRIKTIN